MGRARHHERKQEASAASNGTEENLPAVSREKCPRAVHKPGLVDNFALREKARQ